MNLPGRLRLTTLGDVLGAVYREQASGVLELVEIEGPNAGRSHRIHFIDGLVVDVEAEMPTARIGEILKQQGAVDPRALGRLALKLTLGQGGRAGEVLVAEGAITVRALSGALDVQRRERLDALFGLGDARLAFHVARAGRREEKPLTPREFLHGRARGRDKGKERGRRRDATRARALATLGLPDGADRTTVMRAFRTLAARLHPDRFPAATAEERVGLMRHFAEITAAYHTLVA
jgi:hypothetical protein